MGQFLQLLSEKAECAASTVIAVDPRGTSQTCSACDAYVPKTLKVRRHSCACGYEADRDVNAARNVLKRGLGLSLQARTVGPEPVPLPEKRAVSSARVVTAEHQTEIRR